MDLDNSVYTVTPPSLYLNENGPSIFLMGFDEVEVKQISQVYDRMFPSNSITYYYDTKNINEVTAPWARAVSGMVDFIIVNADTCNVIETYIATNSANKQDDVPVMWIAQNQSNSSLCKLIINYGQKLFYSVDDMENTIITELESKSA
jgi:hypothetical protein